MSTFTREEILEEIKFYKEEMRKASTEQYSLQSGQGNQSVKRNLQQIRESLKYWQNELEKYDNENSGSGITSMKYERRPRGHC